MVGTTSTNHTLPCIGNAFKRGIGMECQAERVHHSFSSLEVQMGGHHYSARESRQVSGVRYLPNLNFRFYVLHSCNGHQWYVAFDVSKPNGASMD